MKLLIVHNAYITSGGEDAVVELEANALREQGVNVRVLRVRSTDGPGGAVDALRAPFGGGQEAKVESEIASWRPDVLHAHNLYPLLSARLFPKAKAVGAKTFLTLHNFRPLCLNGLFLTPSLEICERCAGSHFGHGIIRGCYRESRVQSLGLALHLQRARTWYQSVDRFIAPSSFLKERFIHYGYPAERIVLQPHLLPEMTFAAPVAPEPYVVYLGRLSEEKGVEWLVETFQKPRLPLKLRIAGRGPLLPKIESKAGGAVELLGYLEGEKKRNILRQATALIMPSECYENFPMAILEANAEGTPALVASLGGMAEMMSDRDRGATYAPRDLDSFWTELATLQQRTSAPDTRRRCQDRVNHIFSRSAFLHQRMTLYQDKS